MSDKIKAVMMRYVLSVYTAAGMIMLGALLLLIGSRRPVTLIIDGEPQFVYTRAVTVGGVLRTAGITPKPDDMIQPGINRWIGWQAAIRYDRAAPVRIWQPDVGISQPFESVERIAANLLLQAGRRLFPGDQILWNGLRLEFDAALPPQPVYVLQFKPASALTLEYDDQRRNLYSAAPTLAGALWQAGFRLTLADSLSPPPQSLLREASEIVLRRAIPITIRIGDKQVESFSGAATVGKALAEAGVSLQGLDYSLPAEDEPLPADGVVRIVRVHEEMILEQTPIPFENELVADPDLEIDQRRVLEPGQYGVQVNRLRVRYEDGEEVDRRSEAEWVVSGPQTQVMGYGTKVVVRTMDTPDGPIEYWRAVRMYATSYSPCRSGVDRCLYGTASGMPVQKGVAAMTVRHYLRMRWQQIYVPGYGRAVIGDTGGGIPGRLWIDLAYSDDDYQSWHHWTTVYFLTPVPANIPYILN